MLFWAIRASIPTKNYENKTGCVFFHCASDGYAPGRRNTTQKSKNNENIFFSRNLIFSSLAKSPHTSGIKSCASLDGFNAVLDQFQWVLEPFMAELQKL